MSSFFKNLFRGVWTASDESEGRAIHVCDEHNKHTIAMQYIRVLIVQDDDNTWYAQSMDIDYAASGTTLENVQENFAKGLIGTLKANLEKFGHIRRVMESPPLSDWVHLLTQNPQTYAHNNVSSHHVIESPAYVEEDIEFAEDYAGLTLKFIQAQGVAVA